MVKVKPTFQKFISTVAPIVPIDHAPLAEAKTPRLIYNKKTHQVYCDLSGTHSKSRRLEKIYHKLLKEFNSYDVQHLSSIESMQLETLKGIIINQTQAYHNKHQGCFARLKLLWRGLFNGGHIADLNEALLLKIDALRTLTPAPKKLDDAEKVEAAIVNKMKEFAETEDLFCKAMAAAGENLQLLINLSQNDAINCAHDLFRKESLQECKNLFDTLYIEALEIKQFLDDALAEPNLIIRSKLLADVFATEKYSDYVKTNTKAAAYYLPLQNLITELVGTNTMEEPMMGGLNTHGQTEPPPGFPPLSWNMKLKNTVTYCFAPAMQHVMRYELLMKELEEMTPSDAPQYANVLQGLLEAKRNAGTMDLG
jgi:hypothetical protein